MPVPDFQTLMLPVLRAFDSGAETVGECLPILQKMFDISEEEAAELLPSGTMTYLRNRAGWARTYLAKAGLLSSPRRGVHRITELGRKVLADRPERIDIKYLDRFPEFSEWRQTFKSEDADLTARTAAVDPTPVSGVPPDELIQSAFSEIEKALEDDLLDRLQSMHPVRFERLILDLLKAMGYGAGTFGKHEMTKASGDGGIDGIIHEDALGLDAVYIQAKRYQVETKVGRPAIQQFIGSLTGEGATKGVFVTTSDFSAEAQGYLAKVQHRVKLIGGRELARLMIRHGVGVRDRVAYVIRSVDEDYFADPEG
ncbi:MAG: restriction endonuclease [Tabrizicola sp.]|nr:restriction endonuclease [Tabrizicola sp.]